MLTVIGHLGGKQMNATDLSFFKVFLLDQKSSILNKSTEFKHEQSSERSHIPDEAEAASHDLSTSLSIHLHERDRMVLFQIDRALGKLEDGTYGQCESCSEHIGAGRLKASPFTTLCIACKEEQEDPRNFLQ
jgi:DnaK suppressor protein